LWKKQWSINLLTIPRAEKTASCFIEEIPAGIIYTRGGAF
jgi:hypothetical protein